MALVTVLVTDVDGEIDEREFNSAVDAVNAAISAQQEQVRRVGVHVGEDDTDVAAVARDLCQRAESGEILVSPLVRSLVATRKGYVFADGRGDDAVAVLWTPVTASTNALPPLLAKLAENSFVGRQAELEQLVAVWSDVVEGDRRAVFVAGTAGIGKTRLVAEAATQAYARQGAVVLHGRCEEDLGLPYQPFVEALNAYVRICPDEVLADFAGHRGADLRRIVTALPARIPDLPEPERGDADGQRFLTFEAVIGLLARVAEDQPVLLVLEDLHWATKPTVLLLRHIIRSDQARKLLVLATYRDDELDRASALTAELADLRRVPGVERIALRGLSRDGVAALVAAAAEQELDERADALIDALYAATDGNPFYIDEVLTHLVESGVIYREGDRWTADPDTSLDDVGLPESVRDVVGRRLARLSPAASRTLTTAAVVGPNFDVNVVESASDFESTDEFVDALDEVEAVGLIAADDAGRYAFAHALIRETLLSDLSSARRARLHRRIGEALEARPDAAMQIEALAFHFGEAVGGADIGKAVDYATRAAEHALDQLAYEAALRHVDRGLGALELAAGKDPRRAATLYLLRAAALQDGPREDAGGVVDALNDAAVAAVDAGAVELLVRAAELMAEETVFGSGEAPAAQLCDDALRMIPDDRVDLQARVLGALAYARATMESATPELVELATSAVSSARAHGDAVTRSRALVGHGVVLLAGADIDVLAAVGDELLEVARSTREVWILSWGVRFAGHAALARGDRDGFDRAHRELDRLGSERRHTTAAGWSAAWDGMLAMLDGRLDDAEPHTVAIVERGGSHVNYTNAFTAQLFYLRRAQGRQAELEPILVDAVAANPGIAGFRAALMTIYADAGRVDEAREQFDVLAAHPDFATVPRDLAWSGALGLLTDACAAIGDRANAAVLHALLAPFAGQLIVAATGVACPGAADRFLGQLAATMGDVSEARDRYDAALRLERQVGAPLLVATTESWLARL